MPDLPQSFELRSPTRRRLLLGALGASVIQGCASTRLTELSNNSELEVLNDSARAHGLEAYATLNDVNVAYAGHWHSLVKHLQPTLVDANFRGASQERLLPRAGRISQFYEGPAGHKAVNRLRGIRAGGELDVWFNGTRATDGDQRDAAALVSDGYSLFLLGPLLLVSGWQEAVGVSNRRSQMVRLNQQGESRWCYTVALSLTPGLGMAAEDHLVLWIDAEELLMRRVSFTLNGLESTRGAMAHVDTYSYVHQSGVQWPTGFHEQLERPFSLGVHDWALTGLDLNRGYAAADIIGVAPQGLAAPTAAVKFNKAAPG